MISVSLTQLTAAASLELWRLLHSEVTVSGISDPD